MSRRDSKQRRLKLLDDSNINIWRYSLQCVFLYLRKPDAKNIWSNTAKCCSLMFFSSVENTLEKDCDRQEFSENILYILAFGLCDVR